MQGKHLILLTLCCLWLYIANARVISSVKSTKVRAVKIPDCGCKRPIIDVPSCGCRGFGYNPTYCTCDLNVERTCGCQKAVYFDPLEIPLCGCGSGLPLTAVYAVEMPCGCQTPETCTCGYKNPVIVPGVYDFVEVPRCGCQSTVIPCGCQPTNACGCQNTVIPCGWQPTNACGCQSTVIPCECQPTNACGCQSTVIPCGCQPPNASGCQNTIISCGCQPTNACGCQSIKSCGCPSTTPCGCQGAIWMNYEYIAPYDVPPCRCNGPVTELPCGCPDGNCGCSAMQILGPYDFLGPIMEACGCIIPGMPEIPIYGCGCQSTPCGCGGSGCGGGCGCGCNAPVVGCTKYLRQVKLQPPFL